MRDDDRNDVDGGMPEDAGLRRVLSRWSAPAVPEGLDDKVLASFRRQHVAREPFWRRFFASELRVPLPVAIAVAVLLLITTTLALRAPAPAVQEAEAGDPGIRTAQSADAPVMTQTSLAGFQPTTEVDATVVLETGP